MSKEEPKKVKELQQNFRKAYYTKSKVLREIIDRNDKVRQYYKLTDDFSKKYNDFIDAYNNAIQGLSQTEIETSRKKFTVDNKTFEVGPSTKFVNSRVRGDETPITAEEITTANYNTIHYYLSKIIPNLAKNYELGHQNTSILKANVALALQALESSRTSKEYTLVRKKLLALYFVLSEIDKIKTDKDVNKDRIIQKLRDTVSSGQVDLRAQWQKDVNIVNGTLNASILLELEDRNLNQLKGNLSSWVGEIFADIIKEQEDSFLKYFGDININNLQGSPTLSEDVEAGIVSTIISEVQNNKRVRVKTKYRRRNKKSKSTARSKGKQVKSSSSPRKKPLKKANSFIAREVPQVTSIQMELIGILNQQLPETVQKNMGAPALEYRTGRFANSVQVTDIISTRQGFPSIGYTYMKSPYQTFEKGFAQGSPDRDPRKIIDTSIREIAAAYAIGRFYTRRT